jgi:hypothetical protein
MTAIFILPHYTKSNDHEKGANCTNYRISSSVVECRSGLQFVTLISLKPFLKVIPFGSGGY